MMFRRMLPAPTTPPASLFIQQSSRSGFFCCSFLILYGFRLGLGNFKPAACERRLQISGNCQREDREREREKTREKILGCIKIKFVQKEAQKEGLALFLTKVWGEYGGKGPILRTNWIFRVLLISRSGSFMSCPYLVYYSVFLTQFVNLFFPPK